MAKGIVIKNMVAAENIDTLNRVAKSASDPTVDIENGSVVVIASGALTGTAGEGEVWKATCPATGSLSNLWMVASPEIVTVVSGSNKFKGIDPDVRNFVNLAGEPLDVFKLQPGDIVTLSADALAGTKGSNTYVVAADAAYKLTWASAAITGVSLKLLATEYISIGTGSLGDLQRVTAYRFEVEKIA